MKFLKTCFADLWQEVSSRLVFIANSSPLSLAWFSLFFGGTNAASVWASSLGVMIKLTHAATAIMLFWNVERLFAIDQDPDYTEKSQLLWGIGITICCTLCAFSWTMLGTFMGTCMGGVAAVAAMLSGLLVIRDIVNRA